MKQEPFAPPAYKEGLEADAVCGQCSTVNPEGTLICKVCGNNLRDQRRMRLSSDQIHEVEPEPANTSVFLRNAGATLALLLVLWLALNAGRIASMLTSAEVSNMPGSTAIMRPSLFWTNAAAAVYDNMRDDLLAHFPSQAAAEAARMNSTPTSMLATGRYVIFERVGTGRRYAGAANVWVEGATWHYLAILDGETEIRGHATLQNGALASLWEDGGLAHNEVYYAVTGFALLQDDGSVTLAGQSDLDMRNYQAYAYRIAGL